MVMSAVEYFDMDLNAEVGYWFDEYRWAIDEADAVDVEAVIANQNKKEFHTEYAALLNRQSTFRRVGEEERDRCIEAVMIIDQQIQAHEGMRLTAYLDSVGVLTVGVAHNCAVEPVEGVTAVGDKISEETSGELFADDLMAIAASLIEQEPLFLQQTQPRRNALLDMAFNLGVKGIGGFQKMWCAIEKADYDAAAAEMLDSKWATQVGNRAVELADMMRKDVLWTDL